MLDRILQNTPMNPVELLSDREIEVAELLVKGLGNIEIANILKIQMSTVSTYKIRIFEKLKISNVVNLSEILRIHKS
ncbi:Virulence factors putative positive transcription regulator BvgA [compost metagenome]